MENRQSKKSFPHFLWRFLREHKRYYSMELVIALLFLLTFYFYDVPFAAYRDALLFSLTAVFLTLVWDVSRAWREHSALHQVRQGMIEPHRLPKPTSMVAADYQELIAVFGAQQEQERRKLAESNEQLLDYYSMWSHQIKTPLSALDLMVQYEGTPKSVMKQELFKIDQYLTMMLQYIRLNHSETDFHFAEIEMEPLVKETVKKYASFFIHKDLQITFDDLSLTVTSDRKWLMFILEQVLSNAIKYTQKGGITIYVDHELEEVVIEDTGIGILPEDIPRIFEKGYTGFNGREQQKATGLGLFMSQQIAQSLGHQLRVESEVGVGTTVFLTLRQESFGHY